MNINVTWNAGVKVDESDFGTDDTKDFSTYFDIEGGADGLESVAYTLGVATAGVDSGLVDSESGNHVFLFVEGGEVVGRAGTDATDAGSGDIVFTVSVDGTGNVTLDQARAVMHTTSDPDEIITLANAGSVTLTATATDGDGDTAADTIDIGTLLRFGDDAPAAEDDSDSVTEDGSTTATGNVLTGVDVPGGDVNTTDGTADDAGADGGPAVTWVRTGEIGDSSTPVDPGVSLAGDYGTVTLNADGTYEYELDNDDGDVQSLDEGETLTDIFTYSMRDADGDTSMATLTITINGTDDAPEILTVTDASYDEEALSEGNPGDSYTGHVGDLADMPDGAVNSTGTLDIDYGSDGPAAVDALVIELDTTGVQTADGQDVVWNSADNKAYIDGTSTEVFAITVNGNGTYTYSQSLALMHGTVDAEDDLDLDFSFTAKDGDGDTAEGSFTVTVDDDAPLASDISDEVDEATAPSTNLMIILDMSGSMDWGSGVSGYATRLAVAKDAIDNLISEYDDRGDVMVRIVTFNSSASAQGSTWMTATAAQTYLTTVADGDGNGGTNYDAALLTAMDAFDDSGAITDAQNVSYFLSDGDPNDGYEIGSGDELVWEGFLEDNHIISFALGMGDDITSTATLDPIAYDGITPEEIPAVIVDDLADLADVLAGSVITPPATGSLLDGVDFGADGEGTLQVVSIAHDTDGNPSTPDDVYDISSHEYDSGTDTLTITTQEGGTLSVNFANGNYSYSAPENVDEDTPEVFTYTIRDGDGDTASAELTITIKDGVPAAVIGLTAETVSVDESADGDDVPGALGQASAVLVTSTGSEYGSDGAGTTGFGLTVTDGTDSGLDTTDGTDIFLYDNAGTIEGRAGGETGAVAFDFTIDGGTGEVELTQYLSLAHPDDTNHNDSEGMSAGVISALVTVTDGDGDVATDDVDISGLFTFYDDGPTAAADSDTAESGHYIPGDDETHTGVINVPAWSTGTTTTPVSGTWSVDPVNGGSAITVDSTPLYHSGGGCDTSGQRVSQCRFGGLC